MKTKASLLLAALAATVIPPACLAADPAATAGQQKSARIDNARIFPYFAAGGGWESTITLINVFDANISYRLSFRGTNGQPVQVSYRALDGRISSASQIEGQLADDASTTLVLLDAGALQTGWAFLEYDGESRISGMITFRQRIAGRPDFESSVALTRDDETRVFIPFDNTLSYATTLAITNPSTSENTDLSIRFWDSSGAEIITGDVRIFPGTTVAFSIPERFPQLNNRAGQLRIESTGSRLSTMALRFNPAGAFNTLPVVSR